MNQPVVLKQIDELKKSINKLMISAPKREGRYELVNINKEVINSIKALSENLRLLAHVISPIAEMHDSLEKKYEIIELYFHRLSSILDFELSLTCFIKNLLNRMVLAIVIKYYENHK